MSTRVSSANVKQPHTSSIRTKDSNRAKGELRSSESKTTFHATIERQASRAKSSSTKDLAGQSSVGAKGSSKPFSAPAKQVVNTTRTAARPSGNAAAGGWLCPPIQGNQPGCASKLAKAAKDIGRAVQKAELIVESRAAYPIAAMVIDTALFPDGLTTKEVAELNPAPGAETALRLAAPGSPVAGLVNNIPRAEREKLGKWVRDTFLSHFDARADQLGLASNTDSLKQDPYVPAFSLTRILVLQKGEEKRPHIR